MSQLFKVEALNNKGEPYTRLASTVDDLPTPLMRTLAIQAIQRTTGIDKIHYGVPVYQTLGISKQQALRDKRTWLMLRGADLPLSLAKEVHIHAL